MDDALPWHHVRHRERPEPAPAPVSATARTGGPNDDKPVLIARLSGPMRIEMAAEALRDANIPVHIKRDSLGMVYGLSSGVLAAGEVWVPRPLAEQATDVLVGIGMVEA